MDPLIDPTESEIQYLRPFLISQDKIRLYGSPVTMSFKSELIKSLLDKLTTEDNILAPDMKVNSKSLLYLWYRMNGADTQELEDREIIDLWPFYDTHFVHIYSLELLRY